jgi:DNA-binding NarL/FixJ family response regulator
MSDVPKRILLITRHVDFSIRAKDALEREGNYVVNAFASASNALASIQSTPHDVVVVDFTVRDMNGERFITQLRTRQPDIGIIVAPSHTSVEELVKSLNVQAMVNLPMPTRQFLQLIDQAIRTMYEAQGSTASDKSVVNLSSEPVSKLDDTNRNEQIEADEERSRQVFQRLSAEEPPMPDFEESATIRDVISNILPEEVETSLEKALEQVGSVEDLQETQEDSRNQLAVQLLETAMDTSTPVNKVIRRAIEMMSESKLPNSERYLREPDFLPDELFPINNSEVLEYTALTTVAHPVEMSNVDSDMDTDKIVPTVRSRPLSQRDLDFFDNLRFEASAETPAIIPNEDTERIMGIIQAPLIGGEAEQEAVPLDSATLAEIIAPPPPITANESYTAQLALSLTEMSLETTADALILSRQGGYVTSGKLSREELQEIEGQFLEEWNDPNKQTRVKFVNLSSTGSDYMLYSIRSENGFTLSLLFAGVMPISSIRRQGKRLVDALATVPEPPAPEAPVEALVPSSGEEIIPSLIKAEEPAPEPTSILPIAEDSIPTLELLPYSFAWITRDDSIQLTAEMAQSIVTGMDIQLIRAGWKIYNIDVYEDFIYLRVDAPKTTPVTQLIRDLMRVSADIVHGLTSNIIPNMLWSDSYFILNSERLVDIEEIQQFIDFARS